MTRLTPNSACRTSLAIAAAVLFAASARATAQGEVGAERPGRQNTFIGVDYTASIFNDATDPWHVIAASIAHRRPSGTFIARANVARRFAVEGLQVEVDAYPKLGDKSYAYVNAGYSAAVIYPTWRYGGEVFRVFSEGWETSVGFRRLEFREANVTLFTGSFGRYVGNNWLSLRPYVRTDAVSSGGTGDTEFSASFTARHYFDDPESYVGGRISGGNTPSDRLTPDELTRSNAWSVGMYGSKAARSRAYLNWGIDSFWEEVAAGQVRNRLELLAGIKLRY